MPQRSYGWWNWQLVPLETAFRAATERKETRSSPTYGRLQQAETGPTRTELLSLLSLISHKAIEGSLVLKEQNNSDPKVFVLFSILQFMYFYELPLWWAKVCAQCEHSCELSTNMPGRKFWDFNFTRSQFLITPPTVSGTEIMTQIVKIVRGYITSMWVAVCEELPCQSEEANSKDPFAVVVTAGKLIENLKKISTTKLVDSVGLLDP